MGLYQGDKPLSSIGKSPAAYAKDAGYTGTDDNFYTALANMPEHLSNQENPHGTTASQVGADVAGAANEALNSAKAYTDQIVAGVIPGDGSKESPADSDSIFIYDNSDSGKPKKTLISKLVELFNNTFYTKTEIDTTLQNINASGAGAHNSIYRGKYLGNSVTAEQYAAIAAGTFDDLYIGDYWTIGGVNYRIAAFDYYLNTGNTACNTNHVTVVPDTQLYTHCMNDTNITTGAYVGSKMYTEGLTQAKTTINTAFGEAHILNHRQYLQNAVTDGYASAVSWYDSTVELMTEQNVYGCKVFGNCKNGAALPTSHTVDKSQYPLFAFRPDLISNRQWFWLRDVVSDAYFALVATGGDVGYNYASNSRGVRPAFSIKA